MNDSDSRSIEALRPGDHFCSVYETRDEHVGLLSRFIGSGLANGEYCIHVIDDASYGHVSDALEELGIDVGFERRRHTLQFVTKWQYRQTEQVQIPVMAETIGRFMREATAAGFQRLRLAVDMTWTLGPDIAWERLGEWEAYLDGLLERSPAIALCMYNQSRMPKEAVARGLENHPCVWDGRAVGTNPRARITRRGIEPPSA